MSIRVVGNREKKLTEGKEREKTEEIQKEKNSKGRKEKRKNNKRRKINKKAAGKTEENQREDRGSIVIDLHTSVERKEDKRRKSGEQR